MASFAREVAYRIFAQELRDTTLVLERDLEDAYAPQYVVAPTGAKVNRVFVVGTLTDKEDIGTDAEYWRARISDPTGTFFVYAGQYQPDATRVIADAEVPSFLAVVGKVGVYTTEDGNIMTSIRPETITVVDAETRDRWVLETARQTLDRIKELEAESSPSIEMVKEHYSLDTEQYREMAISALESMR
ncbi:MAG: DNA-binding protein [Methanosarcinales archaeon]|nr:MAG: DNA-binding protein [Methanosarcinales archaeon]